MSLNKSTGVVSAATAVVSGYFGVHAALTPTATGFWDWWPLVLVGMPIILLTAGLLIFFPAIKKGWIVSLAATVIFVIWLLLVRHLSTRYSAFAAIVVLAVWALTSLASAVKRTSLVALVASSILLLFWIPSYVRAIRAALSVVPLFSDSVDLVVAVILCSLLISTLVLSGTVFLRNGGLHGFSRN